MKNIGLFILLILVLAACMPIDKTAKITVQGMDVVRNIQTLMLVLLGLFLLVPAILAGYIIIRILVLWRHGARPIDFVECGKSQ